MIRSLFRLVALAVGLVLGLAMLAMALLVLLGAVVWSLLRGRKPVVNLHGVRRAGRRMNLGEVVDVEAREVSPAPASTHPTPHQRLADSSARISP